MTADPIPFDRLGRPTPWDYKFDPRYRVERSWLEVLPLFVVAFLTSRIAIVWAESIDLDPMELAGRTWLGVWRRIVAEVVGR